MGCGCAVAQCPCLTNDRQVCAADAGQPASAPGDMPLTAQTADVLSAYSAEQGDPSQHRQLQCCRTSYGCEERAQSYLTTPLCTPGFKEITVDKLSELRGPDGCSIALLDVRTPEEYGEQLLSCLPLAARSDTADPQLYRSVAVNLLQCWHEPIALHAAARQRPCGRCRQRASGSAHGSGQGRAAATSTRADRAHLPVGQVCQLCCKPHMPPVQCSAVRCST